MEARNTLNELDLALEPAKRVAFLLCNLWCASKGEQYQRLVAYVKANRPEVVEALKDTCRHFDYGSAVGHVGRDLGLECREEGDSQLNCRWI